MISIYRAKTISPRLMKTHTGIYNYLLKVPLVGQREHQILYTKPYIHEMFDIPGIGMKLKVILELIK